jgi:hypothetical protein
MFKRDKDDRRSPRQVIDDVSHDVYHRAARLDKRSQDGRVGYRHDGECEWTRANDKD